MIRVFLYDPASEKSQFGGEELIKQWKASATSIIWLDLEGLSSAEDNELLENFSIHPLAIQDAMRPRHPPKIERFDNFLFILFRGLGTVGEGLDTRPIQLSLFVAERALVTRHSNPSDSVDWLFDRLQSDSSAIQSGPGALAIRLSNRLARRYVQMLLELEPRLDEIEDEMFRDPDDALLAELTGYKSSLRKLTRTANYHRDVATDLRNTEDLLIDPSLIHEIVDLYEQIERTQSLANMYYQICNDLTDSYLGLSSHRLNRVMQLLTIITVIFVPLTFMAGIYGMNFTNMPELATKYGYFVLIAVMLVVAILQVVYFRRKRWL